MAVWTACSGGPSSAAKAPVRLTNSKHSAHSPFSWRNQTIPSPVLFVGALKEPILDRLLRGDSKPKGRHVARAAVVGASYAGAARSSIAGCGSGFIMRIQDVKRVGSLSTRTPSRDSRRNAAKESVSAALKVPLIGKRRSAGSSIVNGLSL